MVNMKYNYTVKYIANNEAINDDNLALSYNGEVGEEQIVEAAKLLLSELPFQKIRISNTNLDVHIEVIKEEIEYVITDSLLSQAKDVIKESGRYSPSALQRKFKIDYDFAEAIIKKIKAEDNKNTK